jgi:uncharacterized membrane protein
VTKWQVVLATAGLLISGYLTATHYFAEQVPLACSTGGIVDCEQVTDSAESMLGPVPVAVLGVLWFIGYLLLLGTRATRANTAGLLNLELIWSVLGLAAVFYLVYAELFLIGALCPWCTAIHLIIAVLFLMTLWESTAPRAATYEPT